MDETTAAALGWLDGRAPRMEGLLVGLTEINSYSGNPAGLAGVARVLRRVFGELGAEQFEAHPPDVIAAPHAPTATDAPEHRPHAHLDPEHPDAPLPDGFLDPEATELRDALIRETASDRPTHSADHDDSIRNVDAPIAARDRHAHAASPESSDAPVPQTLVWRKHHAIPGLPRVLLLIHYDTVYPPADPPARGRFDRAAGHYLAPGAADAKGGIVVLLYALLALEHSPWAGRVAWTVALNPDEEVGSPGSADLLIELARGHDLAMVFEPAPSAAHMAVARKGSGNFTARFAGRSAHAGREIEKGRNAVLAAARFALAATDAVTAIGGGATLNVGRLPGGGPVNVVPDAAAVEFNVRAATPAQAAEIEAKLAALVADANRADGITAALDGRFSSPPWVQSPAGARLFAALQACGQDLGLSLTGMTSGGASDANKVATAGIPVLDSLGPVGHQIHSPDEHVELASLVGRAKLAASFLMRVARAEIRVT